MSHQHIQVTLRHRHVIRLDNSAAGLGVIRIAGEAFSRVVGPHIGVAVEEGTPQIELTRNIMKRYHPEMDFVMPYDYLLGMRNTMICEEAIRIAMDKVGYENLTGAAVIDGFNSISHFDTGIGAPASYTDYPGDRVAMETYRIWGYDVASQKVEVLTDWFAGLTFRDLGYVE